MRRQDGGDMWLTPLRQNITHQRFFRFPKVLSPCPATTYDTKSKFQKDFSCIWATSSAIFTDME
jgi:hypothetical protein